MKKLLVLVLALALCLGSLVIPALADDGPSGELILYTTVSERQYTALVIDGFMKKYPNIDVKFTKAGAGESKARIINEKDNPQADAMFGGLVYADTLGDLADCLEPYVSIYDEKMPDDMKHLLRSDKLNMEIFLDYVDKTWNGDIANFLRFNGMSDDEITSLKAKCVE